jgi:hypothetical protein
VRETARLYKVLTDKLGSDTTEAIFKYIDSKTERSVESNIQALATKNDLYLVKDDLYKEIGVVKDDLHKVKNDLHKEIGLVKDDLAKLKYDLGKDIGNSVKWMFIFWIGQVGATLAIVLLFLKK